MATIPRDGEQIGDMVDLHVVSQDKENCALSSRVTKDCPRV